MKEKIVALVPIKAHSERVPAKNFKLFNGKPLFHWIIDTLLAVEEIDTVVINTDARELLLKNGLKTDSRVVVRDRKAELLGDFTNINLILHDDMMAHPADLYLMTHTTNPLLRPQTIRDALRALASAKKEGRADSLFAVNRFQSRFYDHDWRPLNHNPKELLRTQDLKPLYEENSNLYLYSGDSFRTTGARIGAKPILFETPRSESADIDDHDSWIVAEALGKIICEKDKEGGR